eukprot:8336019-Ditylum_brightwellii.AAC.1
MENQHGYGGLALKSPFKMHGSSLSALPVTEVKRDNEDMTQSSLLIAKKNSITTAAPKASTIILVFFNPDDLHCSDII